METAAQPTYQQFSCPICIEWQKHDEQGRKKHGREYRPECHNCGNPIPVYEQGRVEQGFDSFTIHHYHFDSAEGISTRTVVKARLCFECLLEDWNKNYPGQEYGASE